jgi:hypothetical protein
MNKYIIVTLLLILGVNANASLLFPKKAINSFNKELQLKSEAINKSLKDENANRAGWALKEVNTGIGVSVSTGLFTASVSSEKAITLTWAKRGERSSIEDQKLIDLIQVLMKKS